MSKFLKSFLLICLGGFIGVGGVLFILVLAIVSFSSNPMQVQSDSWLVLDFGGELVERPLSEHSSLFGPNVTKMELLKYVKSIEMAAEDRKIKGILINGDLSRYNRVHVEEIAGAISRFKTTGKKVYAWFSEGSNVNYMLCSVADKIYMPNTKAASLTLKGYALTVPYLKSGLDKLGVNYSVIHIGDYKGAGENYVRDRMSFQFEESYRHVYDELHAEELKFIAERREIESSRLNTLIADGKAVFIEPDQALEYKLIDGKLSFRELKKELAQGAGFNSVSIFNYSRLLQGRSRSSDKIALVYVDGAITNYYSYDGDRFRRSMVGAKSFVRDIERIGANPSIKAVVIRVNSPGGSALASELMLQALYDLRKSKPVYVSMGPVAASGGYYVSMGGQKIFASPFTITGSIGVVSMHMEYEELAGKLGVNFDTLKKYEYDDLFTSVRELTESEVDIIKRSMLGVYDEFTSHVITERGVDADDISLIAEGRIWSGGQAAGHNLIDTTGGLLDTIKYAVKENDIMGYSIVSYPRPYTFFEKFKGMSGVKLNVSMENVLKAELLANRPELKAVADSYNFYKENGSRPAYYLPYILE